MELESNGASVPTNFTSSFLVSWGGLCVHAIKRILCDEEKEYERKKCTLQKKVFFLLLETGKREIKSAAFITWCVSRDGICTTIWIYLENEALT